MKSVHVTFFAGYGSQLPAPTEDCGSLPLLSVLTPNKQTFVILHSGLLWTSLTSHSVKQNYGLIIVFIWKFITYEDVTVCKLTMGEHSMTNLGCQLDYIWYQLKPKLLDTPSRVFFFFRFFEAGRSICVWAPPSGSRSHKWIHRRKLCLFPACPQHTWPIHLYCGCWW